MVTHFKPGVLFRFRRPNGSISSEPSLTMRDALKMLSETEELHEFVANARNRGRRVVLEVFHARDGRPLLIHIADWAAGRELADAERI